MRYIVFSLLLLSECIHAQPPGLYRPDSTAGTADIRERLVQLAIQGPSYEMVDHASQAAASQITIAKSAYLGLFSAQGNINEFTVRNAFSTGNSTNYQIYYPKYNFGLNVPFDVFTRTKNTVKIAKDNYLISLAEKNQKFREIKADILSKYENYLLAKQLVEFQTKLTQNEYSQYKRAESDFADNLIKLDDVEKAQRAYITEEVKSLSLQKDLNLAKIEIEKVIGVKIEDVEKGLK